MGQKATFDFPSYYSPFLHACMIKIYSVYPIAHRTLYVCVQFIALFGGYSSLEQFDTEVLSS